MKAVVVYESHWGNTAEVARAIASGLGPDTPVLGTDEAIGSVIADADLIVAGAPVIAFRLETESIRQKIAEDADARRARRTDASVDAWLARPAPGRKWSCSRVRDANPAGRPGERRVPIERGLEKAGYRRVAKAHRFFVTGRYGPLRDGELEACPCLGFRALSHAGAHHLNRRRDRRSRPRSAQGEVR